MLSGFAAALLLACGAPQVQPTSMPQLEEAPWQVWDGRTGEPLAQAALRDRVVAHDVVYVGEQHDEAAHHALQGWVVDTLTAAGSPVIVGLEMLPWEVQPALDAYGSTHTDLGRLATESEWDASWGLSVELYEPLLTTAESPYVRLVALNAPDGLSRQVADIGFDELPDDVRTRVPASIEREPAAYRQLLADAFAAHGGAIDDPDTQTQIDRFFEAQLLWDTTMAASARRAVEAWPHARLVIAAGSGHVMHRWGIPHRLGGGLTIVCLGEPAEGESRDEQIAEAVTTGVGDVLCATRR